MIFEKKNCKAIKNKLNVISYIYMNFYKKYQKNNP